MFALNEVLYPTQFYGLSSKLLPAVIVFNRASEYDWCALVFEHLLFYLKRFEKSFETHGFASGCAGCTIFLVVFYLNRLKRKPIAWGLRPRIKYWNTQSINVAKEDDKLDTGDYGKLRCLDIAYGEVHPQVARDTIPRHTEGNDDEVNIYAKKYTSKRKKKVEQNDEWQPQ